MSGCWDEEEEEEEVEEEEEDEQRCQFKIGIKELTVCTSYCL
jgi:hypothetical protein